MPFSAGSVADRSSGDLCKSLSWLGPSLEGAGLVKSREVALELSVAGRLQIVGVRVVLTLLEKGWSESVVSWELIAVVVPELVVEVVSAQFKLVAVEVVSVGFVSLEEVEGTEISAG